ncbi:MAG: hypothetical protein NT052_01780 [Candidatus Shapirobacteria bacterium]|nr:hypothetical protein [Candidatus Shapirobacteria bacterium]
MKYLLKSLPTFLVFLLVFLFLTQRLSFGISQDECKQKAENNELGDDAQVCLDLFNQSLQSVSSQRVSLESEVKRFNTAILITSTNILTTAKQIDSLEKEINSLDNKIGQLDVSLNQVSVILES